MPHPILETRQPLAQRLRAVSAAGPLLAVAAGSEVVRDPENTRTVLLMVALLALAGVVLLAVTIWFWRTSRPEHPSLGPLEVMGTRRFWRSSATDQVAQLDQARPDGAEPERQVAQVLLPFGPKPAAPSIDLQRTAAEAPLSFEDLAIDDDEAAGDEPEAEEATSAAIDPLLGPRP